jgi:hypothetical protein
MNSASEDIIPKLKFISRLNKGDKINVKNMIGKLYQQILQVIIIIMN